MKTILVLCALFAASYSKIAPLDLIDEVKEQIAELKSIIQGDILVAHDDLQNEEINFLTYAGNVLTTGQLGIQQEAETIRSQLLVVKALAQSVGVDPSPCTDIREATLERLPRRFLDQMGDCVNFVDSEGLRILDRARYVVDIVFTQVVRLEEDVDSCNGNLLCIQPLLTEIQLDKVRLPQRIRTEIDASQNVLDTLKVSLHSCADDNEAQYVSQASTILGDIVACVDRLT